MNMSSWLIDSYSWCSISYLNFPKALANNLQRQFPMIPGPSGSRSKCKVRRKNSANHRAGRRIFIMSPSLNIPECLYNILIVFRRACPPSGPPCCPPPWRSWPLALCHSQRSFPSWPPTRSQSYSEHPMPPPPSAPPVHLHPPYPHHCPPPHHLHPHPQSLIGPQSRRPDTRWTPSAPSSP